MAAAAKIASERLPNDGDDPDLAKIPLLLLLLEGAGLNVIGGRGGSGGTSQPADAEPGLLPLFAEAAANVEGSIEGGSEKEPKVGGKQLPLPPPLP